MGKTPTFRNQYESSYYPKPIKIDKLHECNLTEDDYVTDRIWTGKGNKNCSDPIMLRRHITANIEDFNIEKFRIVTFDQQMIIKYSNDTSLKWKMLQTTFYSVCHTLTLSEELIKLGIHTIYVDIKNSSITTVLQVFVHLDGLLHTDLPDAAAEVYHPNHGYSIPVAHEMVTLKNYNEASCNNDIDYKLDQCRLEYILLHSKTNVFLMSQMSLI